VEGHAVDARADVYALGVVLYEALCGRVPFTGDTEAATALARLHSEPLRPRNVRAGIPKELEEVVMRALARDPDQRYPSASAFRAALLAAARAAPPEPVPVPLPVPSRDPTVATSVTGAGVPADATPPRAPPPAFVSAAGPGRTARHPAPPAPSRSPSPALARSTRPPVMARRTTQTSATSPTAIPRRCGRRRATTVATSAGSSRESAWC